MENYTEIQYQNARNRVVDLKRFYRKVFVFIIVIVAVSLFRLYRNDDFSHRSGISFIFIIWGILLAIKAVKLFFLNTEWENDMIKKELKNQ
ncbi:2TM domain-containing protein [Chryseobacterium sp.]|uniref:2TM domain-containing protein n=1 Tax=Chryseobacterium sp. TaxID=1871047 RepID=UPI0011C8BB95|nr:2TM domain-containing protein [Chryseobacterium sp.]TXF76070.1 2TM domain-containing protein [Chryseobacterium sp.]